MKHFSSRSLRRGAPFILFILAVMALLPGCRGGGGPEWAGPPLVVEGPPFVELTQLTGPAPLSGDRVRGGAGDWLLRNERLAVVVAGAADQPSDPAPGTVIDAASVGGGDLLESLNPCGVEPELSSSLFLEVFHDASADSAGRTLVARGRVAQVPDLMVETRITLQAGSNALHLATTVTNLGQETVRLRSWGDAVRWGDAVSFVPGAVREDDAVVETGPFVTAAGDGAAYAWVVPSDAARVESKGSVLRSAGSVPALSPGESLRFERVFLVGAGSWADVADLAWAMKGEPVGRVLVEAVDPQGAPVSGALAEVRDQAGRVWARGLTPASGMTALPAPPGHYHLMISHPTRRSRDAKRVKVEAGGLRRQSCRFSDPGRLQLSAFDERGRALAARWTLIDLERDGAPGPVLFSSPASEEALLAPGRYRATVTHGPGYEPWSGEIEVKTAGAARARARLTALPFVEGWVAADLGERLPGAGPRSGAQLRTRSADGFVLVLGSPRAEPEGFGAPHLMPPDAFRRAGVELIRIPLGDTNEEFMAAWDRWMERLAAGEPVVAVAGSGRGGDGDPRDLRSYIGFGAQGALSFQKAVDAVAAGRVVASAGPFVHFTLEGAEVGSAIQTPAGQVRGHVRVIAPRSVSVTEILIYVNNEVHAVYRVPHTDRPVRFDEDIELHVTDSSLIVARVDGFEGSPPGRSDPTAPPSVDKSERKSQPLRPLAFTNPIRVAISGS